MALHEWWLGPALLLGASGCDDGSATRGPAGPSVASVELCDDLDELNVGRFFLQNNQWGKAGAADFEQCVERPGPDLFPVGWHFRWPEGATDQVRGYPFIGFGQDPWRPSSTLPELPRQASHVGSIAVTHEIESSATGKYNLAFDIWITSELGVTTPPEANLRREVMIWLDYSANPLPAAWLLATVTIDGELYDFYKGANEPTGSYVRDYLAFLRTEPRLTGTTNIDSFIRYLVDNGHVLPDEYVRNVFLGNEIWHGTGSTSVRAYSVSFD